jgi:hypothetical protein
MVRYDRAFLSMQFHRLAKRRSRQGESDGRAREAAAREVVAVAQSKKLASAIARPILEGAADLWIRQRKLPPD